MIRREPETRGHFTTKGRIFLEFYYRKLVALDLLSKGYSPKTIWIDIFNYPDTNRYESFFTELLGYRRMQSGQHSGYLMLFSDIEKLGFMSIPPYCVSYFGWAEYLAYI